MKKKELLETLEARFEANGHRHKGIRWQEVRGRLDDHPAALVALGEMEATGGEPDVIGRDKDKRYVFCDCSAESPAGRRSVCYDREALDARKEHKPKDSATGMAAAMGIELLTEAQYRDLQELGEFDTTTSSFCRSRYCSSVRIAIPMPAAISMALFSGRFSLRDSRASPS